VSGLIVSLIVLGLSGPLLWLLRPQRSHLFAWLAATPPALVCIWLIASLPAVSAGAVLAVDYPWIPDLGLNLTLRIDGLGLLFGVSTPSWAACWAGLVGRSVDCSSSFGKEQASPATC
jgi:NADH:ubiquinone oxidoreductase subunit 5 (subunit L)/multisubunit Na+/H+ antiporter MnhA subunit